MEDIQRHQLFAPMRCDQQILDQFTCAAITGLLASDQSDARQEDIFADNVLDIADAVMRKREKRLGTKRDEEKP